MDFHFLIPACRRENTSYLIDVPRFALQRTHFNNVCKISRYLRALQMVESDWSVICHIYSSRNDEDESDVRSREMIILKHLES